jgi:hypothetical protein
LNPPHRASDFTKRHPAPDPDALLREIERLRRENEELRDKAEQAAENRREKQADR